MTAARTPFDLGAGYAAARPVDRSIALAPAEGWSSLALLLLMAFLVGWAIDDAHWVLGDEALTDFLPWAGILGVLWGFGAAKLGQGRLVAHGGGAILATVFLVWSIGTQAAPGQDPAGMVRIVAESVVGAWEDLVVRGQATTTQVAHFVLVLGILAWGTGQFAGYAAYAHRRPATAVLVPGTILFVNVAITARDQLALLVLFSAAALLFLVRFHVADEARTWARHRIADVGDAAGLSVRAGLSFVAIALVASLGLTAVASSAPLAGAWPGVQDHFVDLGNQLARLFPAGGSTRFGGVGFGSTVSVTGEWTSDDTPVLAITTDPGAPRRTWRAVAYDRLSGNQWSRSATAEVPVTAGDALLEGTSDAPMDGVAYEDVSYVVRGLAGAPGVVLAPGIPATVDRAARVTLITRGGETWFGIVRVDGAGSYAATAAIPVVDETVAGAVTENRLRAAGTGGLSADLVAAYTDLQPGTAGDDVRGLLATVLDAAKPTNAYDTARAIESYLRDPVNFSYDTNVLDVECGGRGIADCFAVSRRGYCEHFATTMVVMLRLSGIPSRLVEGYLPGSPDAAGEQIIRKSGAHAWVEAWFDGIGWVSFDPTGGGVGEPVPIPAGPPIASQTPGPAATAGSPGPTRRPGIDEPGGPAGGTSVPPRTPGIGPVIVIVIPLGGVFLALAVTWFRRRLGRPVQPEIVYRTVVGMAARFGHPRRPTQTVYEYLGSLSEAVPSAGPELQLVARSTVETTYGRRRLPPDRLVALGEAQRRLRFALLRLLVRRPGRRP